MSQLHTIVGAGAGMSFVKEGWRGRPNEHGWHPYPNVVEARILEIWDTGVRVNDDPVVGFRLEVQPPDAEPYEATTKGPIFWPMGPVATLAPPGPRHCRASAGHPDACGSSGAQSAAPDLLDLSDEYLVPVEIHTGLRVGGSAPLLARLPLGRGNHGPSIGKAESTCQSGRPRAFRYLRRVAPDRCR